jgi:hypothetical protein
VRVEVTKKLRAQERKGSIAPPYHLIYPRERVKKEGETLHVSLSWQRLFVDVIPSLPPPLFVGRSAFVVNYVGELFYLKLDICPHGDYEFLCTPRQTF